MRVINQKELFPVVNRPPMARLPDAAAFLTAVDICRNSPLSEHSAAFPTWNSLHRMSIKTMTDKGIPIKHAYKIRKFRNMFNHAGIFPDFQDKKEHQAYFRQFAPPDKPSSARYYDPALPEKYRPHQLGEEQRALPVYSYLNQHPAWAKAEDERLAAKKNSAAASP